MTANARAEPLPIDLYIRVIRMRLAGAVATFAGQTLVFALLEFGHLFRMALLAGGFAREHRFSGLQLTQRVATKPTILTKARWGQEVPGNRIDAHNGDRQQKQPQHLGRHFE